MPSQTNALKINKKIVLPIEDGTSAYIPDELPFLGNTKLLEQLAIAIQLNRPVLMIGETGTGKTSAIRYLAAKTKNGFRRVNLNGGTTSDELVGRTLLNEKGTYWLDGVLIEAMRKGYWVLLDEINAANAEVLFKLHPLLDDDGYIVLEENGGEIVKPHKNFRLFAAMNPSDRYAGTKDMNTAFISRFFVVKTAMPNAEIETKILRAHTAVSERVAEKMVEFAKAVRGMGDKISFVLSTRELIQWAQLYNVYRKFLPSAELAILNKLATDDVSAVKDLLGLHFKKADEGKVEVEEKASPEIADAEKMLKSYYATSVGISKL